jgi:voltage-gated potassium channel
MTSFFLMIARFFRAFARSLKDQDSEFRKLFLVVFALLLSGTLYYHFAENWRLIDALYFSVMTLTTIGSGFTPTHDVSKIFTIIYLLVGIGVMLNFLARVADQAKKEASVSKAIAVESYEKTKQLIQSFSGMFEDKDIHK